LATKFVCKGNGLRKVDAEIAPMSAYLGVLVCLASRHIRASERSVTEKGTRVVSAAAWRSRLACGQLAKIWGARAVGIAGGPSKCDFLVSELGFAGAVDYKAADFQRPLQKHALTGSMFISERWRRRLASCPPHLNLFARVPVCGINRPLQCEVSQQQRPLARHHSKYPRETTYDARIH